MIEEAGSLPRPLGAAFARSRAVHEATLCGSIRELISAPPPCSSTSRRSSWPACSRACRPSAGRSNTDRRSCRSACRPTLPCHGRRRPRGRRPDHRSSRRSPVRGRRTELSSSWLLLLHSSFHHSIEDFEQLLGDVFGVSRANAFDRALLHVASDDEFARRAKRLLGRGDLLQDLGARPVGLEHALDTVHLPARPVQTTADVGFSLVGHERRPDDRQKSLRALFRRHGRTKLYSPGVYSSASSSHGCYNRARLSRRAFPTTDTELKLIAAAATIGDSRIPKNG